MNRSFHHISVIFKDIETRFSPKFLFFNFGPDKILLDRNILKINFLEIKTFKKKKIANGSGKRAKN